MRKILMRKALLDITRRKGRSFLIILGVVIGVFGFTTVSEAANLIEGAFFTARAQQLFSISPASLAICLPLSRQPLHACQMSSWSSSVLSI